MAAICPEGFIRPFSAGHLAYLVTFAALAGLFYWRRKTLLQNTQPLFKALLVLSIAQQLLLYGSYWFTTGFDLAESLPLISTDVVVLAIDAVAADGMDVSWLWDVEYEQLAGRHVICSGPRSQDLAVRLAYGDVEHEVVADLSSAMARAGELAPGVVVDVLTTYTPFQKLRKLGGLA